MTSLSRERERALLRKKFIGMVPCNFRSLVNILVNQLVLECISSLNAQYPSRLLKYGVPHRNHFLKKNFYTMQGMLRSSGSRQSHRGTRAPPGGQPTRAE
jgi:hypothetical protein